MEYKGYNVSDAESTLLHDILQELKAIREILKPTEKPREIIVEIKPTELLQQALTQLPTIPAITTSKKKPAKSKRKATAKKKPNPKSKL